MGTNEILSLNLTSNIPVPAIFFGEMCMRKADYCMEFVTFL